MKTGIIVYFTGVLEGSVADLQDRLKLDGVSADRIEVIAQNTGHFDISDAWWALTAKGMQRIICMAADMTRMGDVRFTGRELRLCG